MLRRLFELSIAIPILFLNACTLSFQNISTHGVAEDLVDENQSTDAKPNLQIPVK